MTTIMVDHVLQLEDDMAGEMELSPLQLKQLVFSKFFCEAIAELENAENLWAPTFDFDGVQLKTEVLTALQEGQEDDPRDFMVAVRFSILNNIADSKKAPYTIEIHAQGWFELAPICPPEEREQLVRVNGASMILSTMRELITQFTARSVFGALTIPTLRFLPNGKKTKE